MVRKIKNKKNHKGFDSREDSNYKQPNQDESFTDFFSIKRFLKQMFLDFIDQITQQVEESIRLKIQEVFNELKRITLVLFLVMMGAAFLLFGVAGILNEMIGFEGAGFLLMAMLLFFLAWISLLVNKE